MVVAKGNDPFASVESGQCSTSELSDHNKVNNSDISQRVNKLVEANENPKLIMSRCSPAHLLIQIHFGPIHVVMDEELQKRDAQREWRANEEEQDNKRGDHMLPRMDESTPMAISAFILPLIRRLIEKVEYEVLYRQKRN